MRPIKQQAKRLACHAAARLGPHRWPMPRPRLWILMYHRILPPDDPRIRLEEPGMVVTPDTFRHHMQWLQQEFELVALRDWVARRRQGRVLPRKACAITFDDGWRDNYEFAFPILKEYGIPATIFVVSGMIGTNQIFWPNRLARLISHPDIRNVTLPHSEWLGRFPPDSAPCNTSPEFIADAIQRGKQLSDGQMLEFLDRAERLLALPCDSERSLLNWDELLAMINSGLIEIGSHTCAHTRLTRALDPASTVREISDSRARIEIMLRRKVLLFCYPNGDVSPNAEAIVKEQYDAAVTTKAGVNLTSTPSHLLRRIAVHEDSTRSTAGFFARLSGLI